MNAEAADPGTMQALLIPSVTAASGEKSVNVETRIVSKDTPSLSFGLELFSKQKSLKT